MVGLRRGIGLARAYGEETDILRACFQLAGIAVGTEFLNNCSGFFPAFVAHAYGFREMDFFKLKIYALHETKYALVGRTGNFHGPCRP